MVGVDLDPRSCQRAVELGVVDRCEVDLASACVGADVIQLAVPILGMEKLLAALARLDLGQAVITDVGSAKGNFIAVDVGRDAGPVFQGLLREGVIVRPVAGYGMPNHLRVTIGLAEENSRFLEALRQVLARV